MAERRFKVVFTDYDYPDIEIEKLLLSKIDCDIISLQTFDENKLIEGCRDADALMVQYARITQKVLDSMNKCIIISRYGIDVDSVDIVFARSKGIMVCNVPDYCINEVADHALALILSLGRKVILLANSVRSGKWDLLEVGKPVFDFSTLSLGLIGFGKIPRNLYEKARNIFKEIKVYDPYITENDIAGQDLKIASFYDILGTCDFISIHCPLNENTRHMFSLREFQLIKPTAYIINTSRGGIINTPDLYQAIRSELIAGAALDVLETEPPGMDFELVRFDNVIITPHAGFYSERALEELKYKTALNVFKVLNGEESVNVVN
ncbi:MAG: C-terminal binding protein [Actinobacteria bacterium]|nr:C-terminal binding protein [Actinomycetota bacterium]